MLNEAYETHVVKEVVLLAAPRPPGGRVFQTPSGEFVSAKGWQMPLSCRGDEGDCRAAVQAVDGRMRSSVADRDDLAAREVIELSFPAGAGRRGLVLASSQSLMSTFLFYQTLAYLGHDAVPWLARVEAGDARLATGLAGLDLGCLDRRFHDRGKQRGNRRVPFLRPRRCRFGRGCRGNGNG